MCGHPDLETVLDLGLQPLCNEFWPSDEPKRPQTYYPLCLYNCPQCSLIQLGYIIPKEYIFGEQYTYLTGSSKSLIEYYERLAGRLSEKLQLKPGDTVVDIGSNDGTFLKAFQDLGLNVLGIEGARKSAAVALAKDVPTLVRFFGEGVSASIRENLPPGNQIRLITAMNVLAHTDNINEFLSEVVALMGPDTVFLSSSHWLIELIRKFEFDTIYHEHLRYYTLSSLMQLFDRHGLSLGDAEVTEFYGGSILGYATTGNTGRSNGLMSVLRDEQEVDVVQRLRGMKPVLMSNKAKLLSLLVELRAEGKSVAGIGAPMKASTLLNFYGITSDLVEYIAEVNLLKVGTDVPGVGIPVIDEDTLFQRQPDYGLLLSWNMADHIIPKYRDMGYRGKFILPVPELKVID